MKPVVSVVIPSHNRAHVVGHAIASVLDQTFDDLEVLVVDDGSTDGTETVVRAFDDSRLRYVRAERNAGASAARNRGIAEARGEYVAFLDSDDRWYPTKLQKQIEVFQDGPASVGHVCTGLRQVTRAGAVLAVWTPRDRGAVFPLMLVGNECCTGTSSTMLVRRHILEQIGGFDETLRSCQDWDLGIRITKACAIDVVPEVLVDMVVEGHRISGDLAALQQGLLRMAAKYRDDIRAQPRPLRAQAYRTYANLFWQRRLRRAALACMARSVVYHPPFALEYGWRAARKLVRSLRPHRPVSEF